MPSPFQRFPLSFFFRRKFRSPKHSRRYVLITLLLILTIIFCFWLYSDMKKRPYTMEMIRYHTQEEINLIINEVLQRYSEENFISEEDISSGLNGCNSVFQTANAKRLLHLQEEITALIKATLPKRSSVKIPLFKDSVLGDIGNPLFRFPVVYTETHAVQSNVFSEVFRNKAGILYRVHLTVKIDSLVFCGGKWDHILTEKTILLWEMFWE